MQKMSKFFKTAGLTGKLREVQCGEVLYLELQDDITFNQAMKIVTSLADRLAIKISQTAMKSVPMNAQDNCSTNVIRIERIS